MGIPTKSGECHWAECKLMHQAEAERDDNTCAFMSIRGEKAELHLMQRLQPDKGVIVPS
jgi:hypothetical protein